MEQDSKLGIPSGSSKLFATCCHHREETGVNKELESRNLDGKVVVLFPKEWIPTFAIAALLISSAHAAPRGADQDTVGVPLRLQRLEVPDQKYIPVPREGRHTSPAYRLSTPGFFAVQVNVNDSGHNIVGDAANEPSLAVDPNNPNRIAIGWRQFDTIASNFRQAGYAYTTDGGITWTFPGVLEPGIFRSDPVLGSDSDGNFYYNSLTNSPTFMCHVFKSSDGGVTWDSGTFAQGGDKQWMVIDKTGGPGEGNIYAYWTWAYSICYPGFFTRSVNHGANYENCVAIPGDPYWGTLDVAPDGSLYVCGTGGIGFVVAKSSNARDSSQTVSWDTSIAVNLDGDIVVGAGFNSPNPSGLLGQAWVAVDRSGGPNHGNVYLLCSVAPYSNFDPLDVMFARSTDGGLTWSPPVRVNDDNDSSAWQWFGTMSVAPNGRIDVIWLDTRDNPGSLHSSLYYSYSIDGGVSWSQNKRLSESFDPHVGWPQQNKMGDYFDMVSDASGARLAWAGTFNGEQDVYYGRISLPVQIAEQELELPRHFSLSQNYPNPFNPSTTIEFSLPHSGFVTLNVFNILGEKVATLAAEKLNAGAYTVRWDATGLPSGVYFYRLQAGEFVQTKKLILLR